MAGEQKADVQKPVVRKYLIVTRDFRFQKGAQCLQFTTNMVIDDQSMIVYLENAFKNTVRPFKNISEQEYKLRAA